MKVLEFAFDSNDSSDYLPHAYVKNCICYAGTHDNDTIAGWLSQAKEEDLAKAEKYLMLNESEGYVWGMLRGGMGSVANLFVTQMQDYLELGSESRINVPGRLGGNWQWRMLPDALTQELAVRIATLTKLYDRTNNGVVG
jgi:4-alpha-glucanotransferase